MKKPPLQEKFDHRVWVKAQIGFPFTLEDVADILEVPANEFHSAWMTPHVKSGLVRKVGTEPSKNRKNKGRQINVYQGTYYLDLEEQERADAYAAKMAEEVVLTEKDEQMIADLLAS